MRRITLLCFMGLATLIAGASLPVRKPVYHNTNGISTGVGDMECVVEAITDNVIRVTYLPKGESVPESKLLLLPSEKPECEITRNDWNITLATSVSSNPLTATINRLSGRVTITDAGGLSINDFSAPVLEDGKMKLRLEMADKVTAVYGTGERGHSFNLIGDTLTVYNRQNYGYTGSDSRINQMNIAMPMFLTNAGYAVIFDDYAAAQIILGNPVTYISENIKSPISYYFVRGAEGDRSLSALTHTLTSLTGRQKIAPLWSLGYITSKYGYKTQAETEGVIDTLKREDYPVDGIVLDLYWYGKEEDMGSLEWEPSQWPDHKKMLADLKKKGVNLVTISQPYVLKNGRGIKNYDELSPKGMFGRDSLGNTHDVTIWVGEGGMFDVSNPDTRKWLSDRYHQLTEDGVTGWWGDLGEPEVHPETMIHANGLTAREYHNYYGNEWSKIISDLFDTTYPDRRLMTMMRGGTIGLQRYSVFPWSTDVSRSWGGMQPQVKIMLNSGLSGLGYMSHDVGGFAVDPANPVDPELYVRWLQLGTFSPILRTHSTVKAEPYHYPEYEHIIKPLIKERYRWLPYNYAMAYRNAATGDPLVRPLNYYSTVADDLLDNVTDQYLWGKNVMVAPVLQQGAVSRDIIFPEGEWIDLNNPSEVYTSSVKDYPAPIGLLPMFVRAGSVIPTADYKMENTGDYRLTDYTLNYYPARTPGSAVESIIYEDNLTSPVDMSDSTQYNVITITTDSSAAGDTITIDSSNPAFNTYDRMMTLKVYGTPKPARVTVNGKKVAVKYDAKTKEYSLKFRYNPATTTRLVIEK
ncbi:MAG: hypothetical protein K2M07_05090 [Muribaculaceae bacterium]|nr:hypothetical protein [Muribaculaceae bacterium]